MLNVARIAPISAGPDLFCTSSSVPPLNAKIQPMGEEKHDRDDRKRRRDRKADAAKAREIEMRIVGNDAQRRQQIEHRNHRQHDDQNAQTNENVLSHEPDS